MLQRSGRITSLDRIDCSRQAFYHIGSPFEPTLDIETLYPRAAHELGLIVTLYDLIPLLYPDVHLSDPAVRAQYHARLGLVASADLVLAISKHTARDAMEHLGVPEERIRIVGAGVSSEFRPPASRDACFEAARRDLPWLEPGFILQVGAPDPRKNLARVIDAYAALPPALRGKHQLVIACALDEQAEHSLATVATRQGVGDRVRFAGFVSDELLVRLYQSCRLFVFASTYEGFGLPLAEAISCGSAVIAANTSSLVELVDDPAALCDPHDVRSIRDAMRRALEDPALIARPAATSARRWTWAGVAERVNEAYEDAVRRRGARTPGTPRFGTHPAVAPACPG
jgi:glycosyltransferase involved in cell wall biosynthesis